MSNGEVGRKSIWLSKGAAISALILSAVGAVLLAKGLYPVDLPSVKNPDFIDTVFDNRAVLWTARLLLVSAAIVLVFGGVFIVVSIGTRMKKGELLRRAGPFEVSEPAVSQIEAQLAHWRTAASVRQEEVMELSESLEESDRIIEGLRTDFASEHMVGREQL
jgi:hypothetical protein